MQLLINGETRQLPDFCSVEDVLIQLDYEPRSVAVAIDGVFVPRNLYTLQILKDQQELDVVAPMQGG